MLSLELIEAIQEGGEEAHEAALALGLLIEREKVDYPNANEGEIRAILGDELANCRLSKTELRTVVDQLLGYIEEKLEPHPMAVWALTKSDEERALPHLINLLDRFISDPHKEHLAYQALVGIINIGIPSNHNGSIAAVQKAARQGYGLVKETANQYLATYSHKITEHTEDLNPLT